VQAAYPPEEEEPSRTGLYVAILIVLLIALAVVIAFLGNTLGWWHLGSSTQSTFALTDVTNTKASTAEATLRSKGLVPVIHNETSSAAKDGFVIDTNPGAGTQVHKGQTITLDVGSGPSTVMVLVPNVEGFAVKDAEAVLTSNGFKPLTVPASCPPTPNGDVCNETPEPNTEAKKGSTVTLYVSNVTPPTTTTTTQPQSHVVPNVMNDTVQAACAAIASQGLICAQSSDYMFQYNPTVPSGLVITTQPVPGSQENANTSVILVISKGPQPVNVPDVQGDTQQAATSALTSQGFSPVTKLDHSDKNQADCGIVTKQDPQPNTPALPGSTVTITVGDGTECNGTGGSPPTTAAIIFGPGSQTIYSVAVRREYI
jgi:beta-lactam-binding protein with PASTA domain